MLHLYFLSVGPVLDPVVTGCCSPPVAVVRGSSGCRSRFQWLSFAAQWLSFVAPPEAVGPVAVVPGAPVLAFDRLSCQWL